MNRSSSYLLCRVACLAALTFTRLHAADSGVSLNEEGGQARVTWPISSTETGNVTFSMDESKPLISALGVTKQGEEMKTIASNLDPVTLLTVGSRDMEGEAGWVAFFDDPIKRPHETLLVKIGKRALRVTEQGASTTVTVAEASAGSFRGEVRFTFYRNSALIKAETVMATEEEGRAIVYDAGLASLKPSWKSLVWKDTDGKVQRAAVDENFPATPLAVQGRSIVAESAAGSLAVFAAPHRFFYPLDEAYNLKFVWHGKGYGGQVNDYGLGIRNTLDGDKRHVPWFNAPPKTQQELGAFYLISSGNGEQTLEAVGKFTHGDRYAPLAGYQTFTSHYHVEHTYEFEQKQKEQNTRGVPKGMEEPGMIKTFKARGVNIVHLAEFHSGNAPDAKEERRLPLLKLLHDECARLSDSELLILPGEEPNVHLGGHWISFFPKPIYWVLNRPGDKPFVQEVAGYGKVYHVGSTQDVVKLMEEEKGLMWTAHARIKASIGYPDLYKTKDFFQNEHFLGAAWKAMPADLSRPTLGWRVLDLLDDTSNWGLRKYVIAEADLFRMEPDFETYAHMNINYLKLGKIPKFSDGWQPVLDSLSGGSFFTTTGEILIPSFSVGGKASGEVLEKVEGETFVDAELEWTFPLAFAEVISGDGKQVFRQKIDLTDTENFGKRKLHLPVELKGRTWARLEVWDTAANGAFTQPVWIGPKIPPNFPAEANRLPISKDKLTAGFTEVIPTAKTQPAVWKCTAAKPAADWMQPSYQAVGWQEGKSAFGTEGTPGTAGILQTKWDTKDLWIRREVELPKTLGTKLCLQVHHDNKAEVYIDGVLAWKAAEIETRDYQLFEISPEALAKLKPGAKIVLAAHGRNGQGGQVLDVGLVELK